MELDKKHVVITGAGSGIGRAMAERFAADGAKVVVGDRHRELAEEVAERIGGLPVIVDVGSEAEILRLIAAAELVYGPIDLFCSNAGTPWPTGGIDVADEDWQWQWNVHVMAHLWAARALIPKMSERGEGYLLNTASLAGLLMSPGAIPYTVTKHAAVALAESLAVLYQDTGIRFSCLCPGLVETPLVAAVDHDPAGRAVWMSGRAISPAEVAETVVAALAKEQFLILTHPENIEPVLGRATSRSAYLGAMKNLWKKATA
jgi:NAD(P)-dependent dehydrogenase (short-subunit alcohol dehydrogenase family)